MSENRKNVSGGGVNVLAVLDRARDVLAELYAKYQTKIGPFASQAQTSNVHLHVARDAVAELIRCDLDYDDVTDGARWRALPDERVCELACRYCGDDAATRERITAAVKAARMHALALYHGRTES